MLKLYVNINNSYEYDPNYTGTIDNPINWDSFKTSLKDSIDADQKEYFLSGSRVIQSNVDLNMSLDNTPNIIIDATDKTNPWKLHFSGTVSDKPKLNFCGPCNLTLKNGFLQVDDGHLYIRPINWNDTDSDVVLCRAKSLNKSITTSNLWIKCLNINIDNYEYHEIQHSTFAGYNK